METNEIIREMSPSEYVLLEDFLYEAVFQADDGVEIPRDVVKKPEMQVYIEYFGLQKDDYCLCAEVAGKIVGAVWVRTILGYGHVDDATPEFAISVYKEYRGCGIGTRMMQKMLSLLKEKGYQKTSLAVQKENYAFRMYAKIGFQITGETEEEYIMEYNF